MALPLPDDGGSYAPLPSLGALLPELSVRTLRESLPFEQAELLTRDGRERSAEELASLPPPDADRWREVRTLDEALAVVREWDGGA